MSNLPQPAPVPILTWFIVQRVFAVLALILVSPLILLALACILLETGRPVFFRQTRVGQFGKPFLICKLRTMHHRKTGAAITSSKDPRVTRVGAILRRYKIDELPQFWNVAKGDMALVGPRPEVPAYVKHADPAWRKVLASKPGITDLSTLLYRNEEQVLAQYSDAELAYEQEVLPLKLMLSARYQENRTVLTDIRVLFLTAKFSVRPSSFDPDLVTRLFAEKTP